MKQYSYTHHVNGTNGIDWHVWKKGKENGSIWIGTAASRALARQWCRILNGDIKPQPESGRLPDLPICTVCGRRVPATWTTYSGGRKAGKE